MYSKIIHKNNDTTILAVRKAGYLNIKTLRHAF